MRISKWEYDYIGEEESVRGKQGEEVNWVGIGRNGRREEREEK